MARWLVVLLLFTGCSNVEKDVAYLGPDRAEKADIYLPSGDGPHPAVLIIHGGGWSKGDKAQKREQVIGTTLAEAGYVCMSINYALQPIEGPKIWPKPLDDCRVAVDWLRNHPDVDPSRIGVIGGSAGGHLALILGATDNEIKAVVSMYAPLGDEDWAIERLAGADAAIREQIAVYKHLDQSDPPVLILHGTEDKTVPIEASQSLAAMLAETGIEHEFVTVDGAPHTFDLQPEQQDLRPIVLQFFRAHLLKSQLRKSL